SADAGGDGSDRRLLRLPAGHPADQQHQADGSALPDCLRAAWRPYTSTWAPSSTTRLLGMRKKSVALTALRCSQMNSRSRRPDMCGRLLATSFSRPRKNEMSIMLKAKPMRSAADASTRGTLGDSAKP